MTHIITQKQVKRIKAILGASYVLKADSLLSELRKALVNKNKAFEALPHLPIPTGDDLAFFGFFLEALLAYHEGNSPESVQRKLTQISNAIAPPSHVSSYYALSILLSIGTMYLSYVLIAIYFPVIAGAAIPYLLHHEVLTIILSGILFIYTAISAITALENQHENQVKASLNQLLQLDYSKLDFPSSGKSQSPSSLSVTMRDDRKEDGNGQHLGAVLLKNESSPDVAIASSEQKKPENASGVELLQSGHLDLVPPSEVSSILSYEDMSQLRTSLPADILSGRRNESRSFIQIEEVKEEVIKGPCSPEHGAQLALVVPLQSDLVSGAQLLDLNSLVREPQTQGWGSWAWELSKSAVNAGVSTVKDGVKFVQKEGDLACVNLNIVLPELVTTFINLPLGPGFEDLFDFHYANPYKSAWGMRFGVASGVAFKVATSSMSRKQNSEKLAQSGSKAPHSKKMELVKALFYTAGIRQLIDVVPTLLYASYYQLLEPWHINQRKQAFLHNVRETKNECDRLISSGIQNSELETTLSLFIENLSQIAQGGLADALEKLGQVKTCTKTSIGIVPNFLAHKNLQGWLKYIDSPDFANPAIRRPNWATGILWGGREAYKIAFIYNVLTALREAPRVYDLIEAVMSQDLNEYLNQLKDFLPKSQKWEEGTYNARLQVFKTSVEVFNKQIWGESGDLLYQKLTEQPNKIIYNGGFAIAMALIGQFIDDWFPLGSQMHVGCFSEYLSNEPGFNLALLDTSGYYAVKMAFQYGLSYLAALAVKGLCQKSLFEKYKDHVKSVLKKFLIQKILLEQLFNPEELSEVYKELEERGVTSLTGKALNIVVDTLSEVFSIKTPPETLQQKFEDRFVEVAKYSPMLTRPLLIAAFGYVPLSRLCNVVYKHPAAAAAASVLVGGVILSQQQEKVKSCASAVLPKIGKCARYVADYPTIVATVGAVVALVATDDPLISGALALSAVTNFMWTGYSGCRNAAKSVYGFFSKKPETSMELVPHQAFNANP